MILRRKSWNVNSTVRVDLKLQNLRSAMETPSSCDHNFRDGNSKNNFSNISSLIFDFHGITGFFFKFRINF